MHELRILRKLPRYALLDGAGIERGLCIVKKNEALNDTGMPDRQANEHMCTLWFQGCRQEKNGAK